MKKINIVLSCALVALASIAQAQSDSFQTLKDKFAGGHDVHCFNVSGMICRAVLWMAGEWEVKEAFQDVRGIRLINIPKSNITAQDLSVGGFRRFLETDHFESLASVRDQGEKMDVFIQESGKSSNRYLILAEEANELTVIEVTGLIDIQKLKEIEQRKNNSRQSL